MAGAKAMLVLTLVWCALLAGTAEPHGGSGDGEGDALQLSKDTVYEEHFLFLGWEDGVFLSNSLADTLTVDSLHARILLGCEDYEMTFVVVPQNSILHDNIYGFTASSNLYGDQFQKMLSIWLCSWSAKAKYALTQSLTLASRGGFMLDANASKLTTIRRGRFTAARCSSVSWILPLRRSSGAPPAAAGSCRPPVARPATAPFRKALRSRLGAAAE